MKKGSNFAIIIFLFATLIAACSGGGEGGLIPGAPVTLTSISVTPANPIIAPGTTTRLSAIGTYSNNSKLFITSSVAWDSSNPGIATIGSSPGSQGLVTAAASTTGSTVITAASGGLTGSTILTTSHVASMNVTPAAPPSIAPGTTMQFIAIGTLSDSNSTQQNLTMWATWASLNPAVAEVSNSSGSKGIASAISAGTATITANYDGSSGSAAFKSSPLASIAVTPPSSSIAKGTTQQFTATGTLADSTTQNLTAVATWSSSITGVATISNTGLATAVSEGTTTIAATLATFPSITSAATLTITPAVITSITVTPVNPGIVLGTTQQFIAIASFSDLTTQDISSSVTWNSSNSGVATVSNKSGSNGLATPVNTGSTTITASSGGFSGSSTLTVTQAVLDSIEITPATAAISVSTNIIDQQFTATGHFSDNSTQDLTTFVTWSSSNTNVASISNTPGFQGLATASFITFQDVTNITATFSGITSSTAVLTVNF